VPEVNVPLLRKAVEWAEESHAKMQARRERLAVIKGHSWWRDMPTETVMDADDEYEWDQNHWRMPVERSGVDCGSACCIAGWVATQVDPDFAAGRNAKGEVVDSAAAAEIAREALGLSVGAGVSLFHSENSIEDVRSIAERIAGERL
jgi:hypothetical protein